MREEKKRRDDSWPILKREGPNFETVLKDNNTSFSDWINQRINEYTRKDK